MPSRESAVSQDKKKFPENLETLYISGAGEVHREQNRRFCDFCESLMPSRENAASQDKKRAPGNSGTLDLTGAGEVRREQNRRFLRFLRIAYAEP